MILEVYAEPEFKGKFLAMNVGMGHDNTYKGGQIDSSNGTKTLRDSITCALELDPDFITFFEWDEWNENTGIRPTRWNSFAARRVVRAMKAKAEGRGSEAPLAGDACAVVPELEVVDGGDIVYSMSGDERQAAFFAPVNAKRAESVADIVPDLPVSVISGHAITADGKICRSKPIVVGARSGEKRTIRVWSEEQKRSVTVEVDRARLW